MRCMICRKGTGSSSNSWRSTGEGSPADVEKEREKLRRLAELIKFQLNPDKFPKVKFNDDVKVPVSTLQLLIKKINEEYVL